MSKVIYYSLACIFLALAVVGAFLPVLPTVPFLLLAAFFAGKSSPRLHKWMHEHPHFGKNLRDWEQERAISRKSKAIAVVTICASWFIIYFTLAKTSLVIAVTLIFIAVIIYLVTRPEPKV